MSCHVGAGNDFTEQALHQSLCRGEATVEESGADQRLYAIGQDRRALGAAAAGFAFGQTQHVGQADGKRDAGQTVFANEMRAHARQVAFVGPAEALVEQCRDRGLQDGVAEELEALVVLCTGTAVGQRACQQRAAGKAVTQALLQS